MKKVMLFIASMLFAFSVNAATLTLTSIVDSSSTADASTTSDHLNAGDFNNGSLVTDEWGIQSDGPTGILTIATPNPGFAYEVTIKDNMGITIASGSSDGASSFMLGFLIDTPGVIYHLFLDSVAAIDVSPFNSASYSIALAQTPIPAALFLFAPALLGFLGLRRKASLAA